MAYQKNNVRHQQNLAKAAQKKKAAAYKVQSEARKAWVKSHTKQLIIGVVVAIIAIAALTQLIDYCYAPAGSLRVYHGNIVGAKDNWLIVNTGTNKQPLYYHVADFTAPEGYTLDPDMMNDAHRDLYYRCDDPTAPAASVYASAVANRTAEDMIGILETSGFYDKTSTVETNWNGKNWRCFYGQMQKTEDDGTLSEDGLATLVAYVDTPHGSSIALMVTSASGAYETLPDADTLLTALEQYAGNLTLMD